MVPAAQRRRVGMTVRLLVIAAISGAITATALAASQDRSGQRRALAHNRALWSNLHVRGRLQLPTAHHLLLPATQRSRDNRAEWSSERCNRKCSEDSSDTIPKMFAAIRSALHNPRSGEATVSYDRHLGFPRRRLDRPHQECRGRRDRLERRPLSPPPEELMLSSNKASHRATATLRDVRLGRDGHPGAISDLDGRRVTTLGSPQLTALISHQIELAYFRIDADGSLREVRISAIDARRTPRSRQRHTTTRRVAGGWRVAFSMWRGVEQTSSSRWLRWPGS